LGGRGAVKKKKEALREANKAEKGQQLQGRARLSALLRCGASAGRLNSEGGKNPKKVIRLEDAATNASPQSVVEGGKAACFI